MYGSRKDYPSVFSRALRAFIVNNYALAAIVCFDAWNISGAKQALLHVVGDTGSEVQPAPARKVHRYSDVSSPDFIIPGHSNFKISTAGVAHSRTVAFLKQHFHGPYFDLEKIWDEHTYYEFGDRSVEKTMATMVQEPYVNHVPTVRAYSHLAKIASLTGSS